MDVHLVSGFLGSGKTTAILAAARCLAARGVSVAVVTNDQGKDLVDTATVRSAGFTAAEVAGGCFCCRPEELVLAPAGPARGPGPQAVFAEAVGSCTDLLNTVLPWLASRGPREATVGSLSVFTDIRLIRQSLAGRPMPFSDDVAYIYESQIAEAGVLVLNKSDLYSGDVSREVLFEAQQRFPEARVHLQDSFSTADTGDWIALLEKGDALPRRRTSVDYRRYGSGEVGLAWYDAAVRVEMPEEAGHQLVQRILEGMHSALFARTRRNGHLKVFLSHGGAPCTLSLTSAGDQPVRVPPLLGTRLTMTINARIEADPEAVRSLVHAELEKACAGGRGRWQLVAEEAFHPSPPSPPKARLTPPLAPQPRRGQHCVGGTMKPALMIIDMQKAYHRGPSAQSMDAACEYINAAAALFRKKGLPVLWMQNKDEEDGALPGLPGFELIDGLKPLETEPRIAKEYGNSFNKTDCKQILESHKVDTVIVTGYCAEYCVLSTCRGAKDLDLASVILRGGVSSGVEQNIGFVERISDVISYGALHKALE